MGIIGMEKAKVLNFLPLCLPVKSSLRESRALETREKVEEGRLTLVEEVQVREHSNWTSTSLWHLMSCTYRCWELLGFRYETALSYLRKIMVNEREQVSLLFPRRIRGTTSWSSTPYLLGE